MQRLMRSQLKNKKGPKNMQANTLKTFMTLVVDSEQERRGELLEILKNCGHSTVEAADAAGARQVVGSARIDLILCQDALSDGSGLSVLQELRGAGNSTPFILMTERPGLPAAENALAFEHADIFDTPGNYEQLFPKLAAFQTAHGREGERVDGLSAATPPHAPHEPTAVHPVRLPELNQVTVRGERANVDMVMDIPISVSVILGSTTMLVQELLQLGPGSVVELDKRAGEPIDIYVNDKLLAIGEVVVVNETFGVRISEIIEPKQRVQALA